MTGWDHPFSDPVAPLDGGETRRLRDAGAYVIRLPNSVYRTEPWRVVIHLLIQAAEYNVPIELARIAVLQAFYPSDTKANVPVISQVGHPTSGKRPLGSKPLGRKLQWNRRSRRSY